MYKKMIFIYREKLKILKIFLKEWNVDKIRLKTVLPNLY